MIGGLPFRKFVRHLLQEVTLADAEMQLLQRQGWQGMNQELPSIEGVDHLEFLGLNQVKVTFWVEPVRLGFWDSIKYAICSFLGKPEPIAEDYWRFLGNEPANKENTFKVVLTIGRGKDGKLQVASDPTEEELKSIYVSNFIA